MTFTNLLKATLYFFTLLYFCKDIIFQATTTKEGYVIDVNLFYCFLLLFCVGLFDYYTTKIWKSFWAAEEGIKEINNSLLDK